MKSAPVVFFLAASLLLSGTCRSDFDVVVEAGGKQSAPGPDGNVNLTRPQTNAGASPSPQPSPSGFTYQKEPGWESHWIVVSLKEQKAVLYKDGMIVNESPTSTGRKGYSTPKGDFEIVQKNRHHVSTIYGAPMPYQMRLNEWSISFHAGYVPGGGRRASHGCIRLPTEKAKEFFAAVPRGTKVTIQD